MKLTALLAVARLCLWTRASANWSAPTILSPIATPRSALCLRVSWKRKQNFECETLSPLLHRFCCNLPRVPKRPRRSVEEEELNEILMKLTLDFTFTLRKVVSVVRTWWNLRQSWLEHFWYCSCEPKVQIEVLPPFWAGLHLRYLICLWGFHVKINKA